MGRDQISLDLSKPLCNETNMEDNRAKSWQKVVQEALGLAMPDRSPASHLSS